MKTEKLKLSLESENSYVVYGIVSEDNDYKLCWAINKQLDFNLKPSENIEFKHKKDANTLLSFGVFSYSYTQNFKFNLVVNRTETGNLIDEFKNFDYLFFIPSEIDNLTETVSKLKQIENIRSFNLLQSNKVKALENLLF